MCCQAATSYQSEAHQTQKMPNRHNGQLMEFWHFQFSWCQNIGHTNGHPHSSHHLTPCCKDSGPRTTQRTIQLSLLCLLMCLSHPLCLLNSSDCSKWGLNTWRSCLILRFLYETNTALWWPSYASQLLAYRHFDQKGLKVQPLQQLQVLYFTISLPLDTFR